MNRVVNSLILAAAVSTCASAEPPATSAQANPTPADLAVQAVQQYDPASLSFSDREFILGFRDASPANRAAAEKVWKSILAMEKNGKARLKIPAMVITANADSLDVAVSDDSQTAKKADLRVKLAKPVDPRPAAGSMIYVIGVLRAYEPKPFMFFMDHGEIATDAVPANMETH